MIKYHIITYGCQMNKSDSERIAVQLDAKGRQPAKNINQADLVVINICSVRQSAVNRVHSKIKQIKENNKKTKIILTGCILEKDKKQFKDQVDQIWPIIGFVCLGGSPQLGAVPKNRYSFVPIMTGCNNFCSYCAVPYTRGREKSRPVNDIIKEVKDLIKNNHKEITLLGQNVNSYQSGGSPQIGFHELLKILNDLPGDFKINFLTSHPKDMSDNLISIIASSKKVSKNIHLPIQSGDNEILKKMNRGYTVQDYKKLIKKIRQQIPKAEISTDFIVGFPGETEKQFQNTVKLIKEMNFRRAFISSYSPRSGTAAAKLKDNIPSGIKKRRKRILLDMF